jgi:hypothetical protein
MDEYFVSKNGWVLGKKMETGVSEAKSDWIERRGQLAIGYG